MKYADIITGMGLLVKAQTFHRNAADSYAKLFNASFTGRLGKAKRQPYTPLQEFYQRMAQWHLVMSYHFNQDELNYRELVDMAALDAGDGLEPGETPTPGDNAPGDERRLKGL